MRLSNMFGVILLGVRLLFSTIGALPLMTKVKCKEVYRLALCVLVLLCASDYATGGVYTFEGESKIILDTMMSNLPPGLASYHFTIQIDTNGNWLMMDRDHVSVFYDGIDVSVLHSGGLGAGKDGKQVDNANVYPGPIPFGGYGHLQVLWLAYCSKNLLDHANPKIPDLAMAGIFRANPVYADKDKMAFYDSFAVEHVTNGTEHIAKISLFRNENGTNLLGEELRVKSYIEVGDRIFPKECEHFIYSRGQAPKLIMEFKIAVQNADYSSDKVLSPPRIGEAGSQIGDWRIKGSLIYRATNWRSEQELRADPALQSKITQIEANSIEEENIVRAREQRAHQGKWFVGIIILITSFGVALAVKSLIPKRH